MRLQFEVFGETQLDRELLRFSGRAINAKPALEAIVENIQRQIDEQFESQGARGSGGWQPIKPATVARKVALGLDPRILHETLRLRESLTAESHPDQVKLVRPLDFTLRSTVEYGQFHQLGTRTLPVRRPVEFTAADRASYAKILHEYLIAGVV